MFEGSYYMSCKLLSKTGLYKLQSKKSNTSNNPLDKHRKKKVKNAFFIIFTTKSNLQLKWTVLLYNLQ